MITVTILSLIHRKVIWGHLRPVFFANNVIDVNVKTITLTLNCDKDTK